jgi:two-component system, cell cycle sensor histidine kinase and response regulator CckA
MPGGGTLTIETGNVDLDEHYPDRHFSVKPGPYVALTVSDTGIGMPADVRARLFEPFFTTKEIGTGTGLGMATVHRIVLHHGGSISVYSEVGKGTSFAVYLPRTEAADVTPEVSPPPTRPPSGGETALVVEDASELRDLVKRMLEPQGYTVLPAANATEALQLFEDDESIAVILTDVVMPGGSGPELTSRMIARRPGLKVLYMSGYTEDAISHHGVLDAGVAFLHKPFPVEGLGRKLREVLDR